MATSTIRHMAMRMKIIGVLTFLSREKDYVLKILFFLEKDTLHHMRKNLSNAKKRLLLYNKSDRIILILSVCKKEY